MNTQKRDFLKIISAALTGQTAEFTGYRTEEEWKCLYKISVHQNLSPMIYEQIYRLALYTVVAPDIRNQWMSETVAAAGRQIVQTERFAKLCETLQEHGIRYVVLKGISCKIWYPKSELRPSGDEDILIDPGDLQKVDEILKTLHFINEESIHVPDVKEEQEISYLAQDNSLYVEVHLNVIGKENQMQRHLNSRFYDSLDQTEEIMFEGHRFFVLEPTTQMIQLMSHFYKHFYGSGVGVRQMIDLILGTQKLSGRIDWKQFEKFLEESHMRKLFAAILNAGTDYLHLDLSMVPKGFVNKSVRPEILMEDMFTGGIYGFGENNDRKLAGFSAVAIDSGESKWKRILFPSRIRLGSRYPKLREKPFLYPCYILRRWWELFGEYGTGREKRKLLKKRMTIARKRDKVLKYYR